MITQVTISLVMVLTDMSYHLQDSTTVAELQQIMKSTDHNGFPVVVSRYDNYFMRKIFIRDLLQRVTVPRGLRSEARPAACHGQCQGQA